jgi:hypothetical protein
VPEALVEGADPSYLDRRSVPTLDMAKKAEWWRSENRTKSRRKPKPVAL